MRIRFAHDRIIGGKNDEHDVIGESSLGMKNLAICEFEASK